MPDRGFFITFEGGEGAGKSTLISSTFDQLQQKGRDCILTREPGDTPLGKGLREILLNQDITICERSELFLFLADRAQHVQDVIRPALQKGQVVLCDRYNDSTLAYQGFNFDEKYLEELCHFAVDGLKPNMTFYLDLDPQVGIDRIEKKLDRLERKSLSYHEKVRKRFLQMASREKERIVVLDATLSKEEILKQTMQVIEHARA